MWCSRDWWFGDLLGNGRTKMKRREEEGGGRREEGGDGNAEFT